MRKKTLNNRNHSSLHRERSVLHAAEVKEILGVCQAKAYKVIRALNAELVEKGVLKESLKAGQVFENYFYERVFLQPQEANQTPRTQKA